MNFSFSVVHFNKFTNKNITLLTLFKKIKIYIIFLLSLKMITMDYYNMKVQK